jgi:alpha-glucosidase
VFSFETLFAAGDPDKLRAAIADGLETGQQGWVLSNHDFSRLVSRAGADNARSSALLVLGLPGPVFLFQGDELGYPNARVDGPPLDRSGRDAFRVPMRWDDSDNGGFTAGRPWLSAATGPAASVQAQSRDPASFLSLVRAAVALHGELAGASAELLESPPGTIAIRRGEHLVAVNLSDTPQPAPRATELKLEARPGDGLDLSVIPAHGGWVARLGD